jgi:hypothetical protein
MAMWTRTHPQLHERSSQPKQPLRRWQRHGWLRAVHVQQRQQRGLRLLHQPGHGTRLLRGGHCGPLRSKVRVARRASAWPPTHTVPATPTRPPAPALPHQRPLPTHQCVAIESVVLKPSLHCPWFLVSGTSHGYHACSCTSHVL